MLDLASLWSQWKSQRPLSSPGVRRPSRRIEMADRVYEAHLADRQSSPSHASEGRFFSETARLSAGRYAAKVNIVFSERAAGERICITARIRSPAVELDSVELTADPADRAASDKIILQFNLRREADVEIYGYAAANAKTTLLRFITIIEPRSRRVKEDDFNFDRHPVPRIADLKTVLIGTTGVCNASCIHCPTNKPDRRVLGHGHMGMALFTKIVSELAEAGFSGEFMLGLFGDPLADPLLEQRLRLIRQLLPKAIITIPTNCGLFDLAKHTFILELADIIPVHVESVSSEIYDRFMHPLKIDRVLPRIMSLLELDKQYGKVHITTPVHKENLAEIGEIYRHFTKHTFRRPAFTRIGNRSWDDGPWGDLSIAPIGGYCRPETLNYFFFVDRDGGVLPCCSDFSKSNRLGNLHTQTIAEVLGGPEVSAMTAVFQKKRWSERAGCNRCRYDDDTTIQRLIQPAILDQPAEIKHLPARAFLSVATAKHHADGSTQIDDNVDDGIVIYGPYQALPAGRYRVSHRVAVTDVAEGGGILTVDANVNYRSCLARTDIAITDPGDRELSIEFEIDSTALNELALNHAWSSFEFRIAKSGVSFVHRGATIYPLA
jgi:sulfatase maturation enzyme AslB (radical SAM superfamily)